MFIFETNTGTLMVETRCCCWAEGDKRPVGVLLACLLAIFSLSALHTHNFIYILYAHAQLLFPLVTTSTSHYTITAPEDDNEDVEAVVADVSAGRYTSPSIIKVCAFCNEN